LDAVTTGTVGNKYALWIEETTEEGTPIFIAEAAGKTQISVLYVEKRQDVQKIAVYSKVSTELLADLPQLISFIESSMMKRVAVKIESELYSGVGTTVYLKGATQWASAFSAGNAANTIPFANEIDVINAIANQVELAFGESNAIMVHPDTILKIKSLKSAQGEPLWKEYQDWSIAGGGTNLVIGGMRVISSPVVTSGEFLGGDMKVLRVLFREQMNIRMVASGDDPINNLMTLIVESRLVQFASANEVSALIKGDFATAIAALTSVA
jgi:HK97 family phage major capsid protein